VDCSRLLRMSELITVKEMSASGPKWQFGQLKRPFSNQNSKRSVFLSIGTSV
jgi:hypothetical protein